MYFLPGVDTYAANGTWVPLSNLRWRAVNLLRPALCGGARRKERHVPSRVYDLTIAAFDRREFPNRRRCMKRSPRAARRPSVCAADCYLHECPDRYANHNDPAPGPHKASLVVDRESHRDRNRTTYRWLRERIRRGGYRANRCAGASAIGVAQPDSLQL